MEDSPRKKKIAGLKAQLDRVVMLHKQLESDFEHENEAERQLRRNADLFVNNITAAADETPSKKKRAADKSSPSNQKKQRRDNLDARGRYLQEQMTAIVLQIETMQNQPSSSIRAITPVLTTHCRLTSASQLQRVAASRTVTTRGSRSKKEAPPQREVPNLFDNPGSYIRRMASKQMQRMPDYDADVTRLAKMQTEGAKLDNSDCLDSFEKEEDALPVFPPHKINLSHFLRVARRAQKPFNECTYGGLCVSATQKNEDPYSMMQYVSEPEYNQVLANVMPAPTTRPCIACFMQIMKFMFEFAKANLLSQLSRDPTAKNTINLAVPFEFETDAGQFSPSSMLNASDVSVAFPHHFLDFSSIGQLNATVFKIDPRIRAYMAKEAKIPLENIPTLTKGYYPSERMLFHCRSNIERPIIRRISPAEHPIVTFSGELTIESLLRRNMNAHFSAANTLSDIVFTSFEQTVATVRDIDPETLFAEFPPHTTGTFRPRCYAEAPQNLPFYTGFFDLGFARSARFQKTHAAYWALLLRINHATAYRDRLCKLEAYTISGRSKMMRMALGLPTQDYTRVFSGASATAREYRELSFERSELRLRHRLEAFIESHSRLVDWYNLRNKAGLRCEDAILSSPIFAGITTTRTIAPLCAADTIHIKSEIKYVNDPAPNELLIRELTPDFECAPYVFGDLRADTVPWLRKTIEVGGRRAVTKLLQIGDRFPVWHPWKTDAECAEFTRSISKEPHKYTYVLAIMLRLHCCHIRQRRFDDAAGDVRACVAPSQNVLGLEDDIPPPKPDVALPTLNSDTFASLILDEIREEDVTKVSSIGGILSKAAVICGSRNYTPERIVELQVDICSTTSRETKETDGPKKKGYKEARAARVFAVKMRLLKRHIKLILEDEVRRRRLIAEAAQKRFGDSSETHIAQSSRTAAELSYQCRLFALTHADIVMWIEEKSDGNWTNERMRTPLAYHVSPLMLYYPHPRRAFSEGDLPDLKQAVTDMSFLSKNEWSSNHLMVILRKVTPRVCQRRTYWERLFEALVVKLQDKNKAKKKKEEDEEEGEKEPELKKRTVRLDFIRLFTTCLLASLTGAYRHGKAVPFVAAVNAIRSARRLFSLNRSIVAEGKDDELRPTVNITPERCDDLADFIRKNERLCLGVMREFLIFQMSYNPTHRRVVVHLYSHWTTFEHNVIEYADSVRSYLGNIPDISIRSLGNVAEPKRKIPHPVYRVESDEFVRHAISWLKDVSKNKRLDPMSEQSEALVDALIRPLIPGESIQTKWLESVGVSSASIDAVERAFNMYADRYTRRKIIDTLAKDIDLCDLMLVRYFFVRLRQHYSIRCVDFPEAIKKRQITALHRRFRIPFDEPLPPNPRNVHVTMCCRRPRTFHADKDGTRYLGQQNITYNETWGRYVCWVRQQRSKPQKQTARKPRPRDPFSMPCGKTPHIRINALGKRVTIDLLHEKRDVCTYFICPVCGSMGSHTRHSYGISGLSCGVCDGQERAEYRQPICLVCDITRINTTPLDVQKALKNRQKPKLNAVPSVAAAKKRKQVEPVSLAPVAIDYKFGVAIDDRPAGGYRFCRVYVCARHCTKGLRRINSLDGYSVSQIIRLARTNADSVDTLDKYRRVVGESMHDLLRAAKNAGIGT